MFADRYQIPIVAGPFTFTQNTDGLTVGAGIASGALRVEKVRVIAAANYTTHATNYVTLSLLNLGTAGTGTTVIATASTSQTGGAAITAGKPYTLTVTAAAAEVSDGQAIGFKVLAATSDAASLTGASVVVHYTQIGPPS